MATTPRQTCWIVRHPGPHGAVSYDRTTECSTLRAARIVAECSTGSTVHRGYGPAGDRGIGDAVR